MGFEIWYENPYLQSVYQYGHKGANATESESRISLLYQLWDKNGTMPWTWDFEHYPLGKDDEMYGQFYPEDFYTILQISYFASEKKQK